MSVMKGYAVVLEKPCQPRTRALVLVIILTTVAVSWLQSFSFNPGDSLPRLIPLLGVRNASAQSPDAAEVRFSSALEKTAFQSHESGKEEVLLSSGKREEPEIGGKPDDSSDGRHVTTQTPSEEGQGVLRGMVGRPERGSVSAQGEDGKTGTSLLDKSHPAPVPLPDAEGSHVDVKHHGSSSGEAKMQTLANGEVAVSPDGKVTLDCRSVNYHPRKKKVKQAPMSLTDMSRQLSVNRASTCAMVPQRHSKVDRQILYAKKQILDAPIINSDPDLYPAIFRNLSMFKRSYELMESTLKVYVYKEGEKPIFHLPELTGIYSSEGWFMKHMEENRHFVVDDPGRAHLFYIPVGSRLLEHHIYVPESHSQSGLIVHMRNYIDLIASKYPFWNRTCGADHFVVACHDWASLVTGSSMGSSIRALCNADMTEDFELGKDVSLPETNVRNKDNPLRNVGGMPPRKRPILAFFAGQMHGYLRPILLQYWENKEPDMKIFGPLPRGSRRAPPMYSQFMKRSKYCICPRGYEVNSPRLVEALFYECVPVIISDNFVPPFFEILNWDAFAVVLPESDVPRLREILLAIPMKKYLRLYMGVKRVQRHFLWNRVPVKYDLFHMILHSIWFNRVFQIRVR